MNRSLPHLTSLALLAFTGSALVIETASAAPYSITVLHNNDGESSIGSAGQPNIASFTTMVKDTRAFYQGVGHGVVTVYAGDSFIPSPEFQASLDSGPAGSRTFYSALAFNEIGYDAAVLGNHEFDAGPSVLAEFVQQANHPFLSANLDFTNEPALASLVGTDIFASTTVTVATAAGNKTVGIIGATTENLPFISTTGGVAVNDIVTAVNAQVAALGAVDHIVLISHLQGINEDLAIAPSLSSSIDLIVAGGGDEILANVAAPSPSTVYAGAPDSVATTGLLTGDAADQTAYPNQTAVIPVVTSGPNYGYLGRVTLNFDDAGNFLGIDPTSNPQINVGFAEDPTVLADVVTPVQNFVDNLASITIASTSQTLVGNGKRDVIRANEAPLGNLVADAGLHAATEAAQSLGLALPEFFFVNGGGIRDDIPAGDITLASTFDISPFGNVVSLVENVSRDDLKLIFENAYSQTVDNPLLPGINPIRANLAGTGRFLHVSEGVEVVYDIFGTPLELDAAGNIVELGSRVLEVIINGQTIVANGKVVAGPSLTFATLDFLLTGGDQVFNPNYLSTDYAFTRLGVTDQQALQKYIELLANGNPSFDVTSDARYDSTPDGRIVAVEVPVVPEPATFALALLGGAALLRRRRNP